MIPQACIRQRTGLRHQFQVNFSPKKITIMKKSYTFLTGAVMGAVAALLLAPESGADLRYRIKTLLKRKGYMRPNEIDILAERIAAEIEG